MKKLSLNILAITLIALGLGYFLGCGDSSLSGPSFKAGATTEQVEIPAPINLLLPKSMRIHPFTRTRIFDETGGIKGVEVRVEAIDYYGDTTKAFGEFRFELYQYKPQSPDPKGKRIAVWEVPLLEPKMNLMHWDNITRTYEFKLQWDQPIAVGQKFVLVSYFSSPYSKRLSHEREFISGDLGSAE